MAVQSIVNPSKIVAACMWGGSPKNCKKLFRPVQTDVGTCVTFNHIPNEELKWLI